MARQSLALPKYLPSYNGGNQAGTLANAFGATLQFGARTIQRRRLIQWQRIVCARSAKSTRARAVPPKAAVVGIISKNTRGITATYCDYHAIENVNGISGNNLRARST